MTILIRERLNEKLINSWHFRGGIPGYSDSGTRMAKVMSNRFWLSLCAFIFGALTMSMGISLGLTSQISIGRFSIMQKVLLIIFLVTPQVYWLYIFFRPRGIRVILSSRIHLSVTALFLGGLLALTLLSLKMIEPIDFTVIPTASLVLIILGFVVTPAAWFALFFRRSRASTLQDAGA